MQVIAQHGWVKTEGLPFKYKDHAWFASFAPKENPQMVVVVFVEHGGTAASMPRRWRSCCTKRVSASRSTTRNLDLSDPDTLEAIKEGQAADARPGEEGARRARRLEPGPRPLRS